MTRMPPKKYVATTNACKLCTPMGASIAFKGIEGAVPFLHGSQGCATYMRRYIISHFNEPIDIASSSLGEKNAVFGGGPNLQQGLKNVTEKYRPQLIGVATTCLTETIGDDVLMILHDYRQRFGTQAAATEIIHVSTPSYSGTHMDGFHAVVREVVKHFVPPLSAPRDQVRDSSVGTNRVNLLPGFVSPADIRHLKVILAACGCVATVLPDYSETMDGPALREYPLIPPGGTPLAAIRAMKEAALTLELGSTLPEDTAGSYLENSCGVTNRRCDLPIGIRATDHFFAILAGISGKTMPSEYAAARGRLLDSMVDGHKYLSGKKAVVYGEEDLVAGLTALLSEIGIQPVLCASGGKSGKLREAIARATGDLLPQAPEVYEGTDFYEIAERAETLAPDLLVGHSKGYALARKMDIPLVRVGFPIHDRLGGQRLLHLGYHGAQHLFDLVVNALIEEKQNSSPVGYSYM